MTADSLTRRFMITVAGLTLLGGCVSAGVSRSDIASDSTLLVLSNLEDKAFFNARGLTVFERQDSAYIPLDAWNVAEHSRQHVMALLRRDALFNVVDNHNVGAEIFAGHVTAGATNFLKLDENAQRVRGYCSDHGANYVLVIQPGAAVDPIGDLPSNRGFGFDQRSVFGKQSAVKAIYTAMILFYDCASGKEIQGVNHVDWNKPVEREVIDVMDDGVNPQVEAMKETLLRQYMQTIETAVRKIRVLDLAS